MKKILINAKGQEEVWVDPFTSELFFNFSLENYKKADKSLGFLDPEQLGKKEEDALIRALIADAEEFIEVVAQYFPFVSINHDAEEYAREFLKKVASNDLMLEELRA
jgi:hypothetical protein